MTELKAIESGAHESEPGVNDCPGCGAKPRVVCEHWYKTETDWGTEHDCDAPYWTGDCDNCIFAMCEGCKKKLIETLGG